jgi:hypothetical protein
MNKTIQPSAHQLLATVPTGLTSVPYPEGDKPMTDEEIAKEIEAPNGLFSLSDPRDRISYNAHLEARS